MNTDHADLIAAPDAAAVQSLSLSVAHLARVLAQPFYPNGDRATLKRWAPGIALPLAYYRLWLQHLRTDPPRESEAQQWMAIIWGLALAGKAQESAHQPQRALGAALAACGFAEARLERLLSAPDALRLEFYQSAVRFLAAKGEGCNWNDWASYLLLHDPEKRERLHRNIAQSYYRNLPRAAD